MKITKYNIKTEKLNGNQIAIISPLTAEKIFNERCPNRPFRLETAKTYAKAMSEGKWKPCSQISFCNGRLDDGQHRMMASILSNIPFEGTIYYHDDPNTFEVFDSGRKRTSSDVLSINGKKYANSLAACLQLMEKINSKSGLPKGIGGATRTVVQAYEIMEVLEKYPKIEYSVALVHNCQRHMKLPPASCAALHYVISKEINSENQKLVDIFLTEKIFKGVELSEQDAVFAFRKHLYNLKRICAQGAQAITHHTMFFGGIVTWNKWVKGEKTKIIRIPNLTKAPKIKRPK